MVNGKMGIMSSMLRSNFMLTILTTENLDFDNGHGQNLDYFTTDIPRFRLFIVMVIWLKNGHAC